MTLSIRHLTLYKHGIAVVERGGAVTGEEVTLTFHLDQMNDVLKSLVAFDVGGGQVRTVAYDAPEDRERKLQRGSIHLSEDSSLVDLLRDLRGRTVRVTLAEGEGAQTLTGMVVGLDVGESAPFWQGRLSLLVEGGVRVLRLREIASVEPLDPQARADLDYFLRLSTSEPEQRTVTLRLSEGEHELVVRYLVPSPTWRVSYRFVGETEEAGERRALLQGWGIFDNPFDEPLEGVGMSLVSGMPISFVYDLYTPFTPERPEVKEEARVAAAPVQMERAVRQSRAKMAMRMEMADDASEAAYMVAASAAPPMRQALEKGVPIAATGEAQGDLFAYRIEHPVSVSRGEAAMVPILGASLGYRKEHVYNGAKQPRHPVVVLRFRNESGLTLERGPITVLENDSYLGEAIFPFTRPRAEVLLAIAVDLGVSVREAQHTTRETFQVSVEKEFLVLHQYTTQQTAYEVSNNNEEALSLLIEHPRHHGFVPLGMAEPEETTEQHRRWRVEVPAGPEGAAVFTVRERRVDLTRQQLATVTRASLASYLRERWLDEALAGELRTVLDLEAQKQRAVGRLGQVEAERKRQMATQEQARKNMSGLKDSGEEGALRARYVGQLNASEDTIAALNAEHARLLAEQARLDEAIRAQLASLG